MALDLLAISPIAHRHRLTLERVQSARRRSAAATLRRGGPADNPATRSRATGYRSSTSSPSGRAPRIWRPSSSIRISTPCRRAIPPCGPSAGAGRFASRSATACCTDWARPTSSWTSSASSWRSSACGTSRSRGRWSSPAPMARRPVAGAHTCSRGRCGRFPPWHWSASPPRCARAPLTRDTWRSSSRRRKRLARRESGAFWRLGFDGVAAHSSQPHKGRSANDACLDALAQLGRTAWRCSRVEGGDLVNRVSTHAYMIVAADERPVVAGANVEPVERPAGATWAPGAGGAAPGRPRVDGAFSARTCGATSWTGSTRRGAPSTTASSRSATGRCVTSSTSAASRGERPEAAIAAHLERLRTAARSPAAGVEVTQRLESPPFQRRRSSRVAGALDRVLRDRGMTDRAGAQERDHRGQRVLGARHRHPRLRTRTGGGNIHRPNEHVPLADLRAAIDIYADVIRELASS